MRRKWPWLLLLLLLIGLLWLMEFRLTPASAARAPHWARGQAVRTAPFPGGVAVLLQDGGRYHVQKACRHLLLLWQPCGGTGFDTYQKEGPVEESAYWSAHGKEGWGISLLTGAVLDPRIARIAWAGMEQDVTGDRLFLFARRSHRSDMFPPAVALSATGVELYEWSEETHHDWVPVPVKESPFPDQPGPAYWYVPVPQDRGDWSAAGSDPRETARRFALAGRTECACDQVHIRILKSAGDHGTYRVRLEGLKDDSIRNLEFVVGLRKEGNQWRVTAATYRTQCRRGISPEGYCN